MTTKNMEIQDITLPKLERCCPKCKVMKALTLFSKRQSRCKTCRTEDYFTREKAKHLIWRKKNAETIKQQTKSWRAANADYAKTYYLANRAKVRQQHSIWQSKQIKENPYFRLVKNLRNRVKDGIKNGNGLKSSVTETLIGCTYAFVRQHLTSLFQPGMTLENYGLWEIDHIIPVASFDLTKEEEQKKCFHWSNMQPLWKQINRLKSDKLNWSGLTQN